MKYPELRDGMEIHLVRFPEDTCAVYVDFGTPAPIDMVVLRRSDMMSLYHISDYLVTYFPAPSELALSVGDTVKFHGLQGTILAFEYVMGSIECQIRTRTDNGLYVQHVDYAHVAKIDEVATPIAEPELEKTVVEVIDALQHLGYPISASGVDVPELVEHVLQMRESASVIETDEFKEFKKMYEKYSKYI